MIAVNLKSVTGAELIEQGYTVAAKVSLWESQAQLISRILEWAHQSPFLWELSETVYEAEEGVNENRETSVIFFLMENDKEPFVSGFPHDGREYLRFEPFDQELFDYYRKDGVYKHPKTP